MEVARATDEKTRSARSLTTIIYALYASSLLVGITSIVAIIINYVKKDDVSGTWLDVRSRMNIC